MSTLGISVQNSSLNTLNSKQNNVSPKTLSNSQPIRSGDLTFGQDQTYENPVNKKWEYFSAAVGCITTSAIVGAAAGFFHKLSGDAAKAAGGFKWGRFFGAGAIALGLTLPVAIYQRSVTAFARTKEMDVFSRSKSAETSISEKIDGESRDKDVPLDKTLDHYMKFQIGRQGNGIGLVNTSTNA